MSISMLKLPDALYTFAQSRAVTRLKQEHHAWQLQLQADVLTLLVLVAAAAAAAAAAVGLAGTSTC
jgi:hypothetical protein